MSLRKPGYKDRLIDARISKYLTLFGAISLEGPKWCGKTWTALNHSESATYMTEPSQINLASVDPKYIFQEKRPQLIDEWQVVPPIWDRVRHECDADGSKGKFILTGSTSLAGKKVFHSGTGRIARLRLHPMSSFEAGDSDGRVSLTEMLVGSIREGYSREVDLRWLAYLIQRGGWPENLGVAPEDAGILPESYLDSVIAKDMNEFEDVRRSPEKMRMLLRSLARNESSIAGTSTLIRDIEEYANETEFIQSRATAADYMGVLDGLYLTADQPAYSLNYRSSARVGKSAKRHLVDPSLCCAALGLSAEKLLFDHPTFGLLFEALAERDLRIYAETLGGRLYHFRDNSSGDEVDAIIEFKDGSYAAFEIKLSDNSIQDALNGLEVFAQHVQRKPVFSCVLVGHCSAVMRDQKTGIFIVPLTCLRP